MIIVADNILNKAFALISEKVEKALSQQGFTKQNVASDSSDEKVALFSNDSMAYSVVYTGDNNHLVLRSCGMTDEGPDNEWKNLATWLFDPDSDTIADAESIGKDFFEMLTATTQIKKDLGKKQELKDEDCKENSEKEEKTDSEIL